MGAVPPSLKTCLVASRWLAVEERDKAHPKASYQHGQDCEWHSAIAHFIALFLGGTNVIADLLVCSSAQGECCRIPRMKLNLKARAEAK